MSENFFNYDFDGDGNYDSYLTNLDIDGDGFNETEMLFIDGNADGIFETQLFMDDINGDGIDDTFIQMTDISGDGNPDIITQETYMSGNDTSNIVTVAYDLNSDGIFEDVTMAEDTTGDGQFNVSFSTRLLDTTGDGVIDSVLFVDTINGEKFVDVSDIKDIPQNGAELELDQLDETEYLSTTSLGQIEANFDPNDIDFDLVAGDPLEDMENWHFQGNTNRCALFSQLFAIEGLTNQDINIEEFEDIAINNGWFHDGTAPADMNKMLNYYGIENEMKWGGTMDDISNCLNNGGKVIVAIDADEIWYSDNNQNIFSPNTPNHAIQVIGIDNNDPNNPMIIVNDSGTPDGRGVLVPADQFIDGWEDSGFQIITAY